MNGRDTHLVPFGEKRVTEACKILSGSHTNAPDFAVAMFTRPRGDFIPSNPKPSRPTPDGHRDLQTSCTSIGKAHVRTHGSRTGGNAQTVDRFASVRAGELTNHVNCQEQSVRGYRTPSRSHPSLVTIS